LARSLCASGSITDMVRLLSTRVEKKAITVAGWATMPQPARRPGPPSLSRGEEEAAQLLGDRILSGIPTEA
jgi:hypothetical protein